MSMLNNIRSRRKPEIEASADSLRAQLTGGALVLQPMSIHIKQIRRYEDNPRQTRNPAFEEIKASIKAHGLDQPLVVTRRPGEQFYVLSRGGGTRLEALSELYDETPSPKYEFVDVLFEEYRSELGIFVSHGIENLKRSDMTYFEVATFYVTLSQKIDDSLPEVVSGERKISAREKTALINERGFSIDHARLLRYEYAVSLQSLIPMALKSGLVRSEIEEVRRIQKHYCEVWPSNAGAFEDIFSALLRDCDCEANLFSTSKLVESLDVAIRKAQKNDSIDICASFCTPSAIENGDLKKPSTDQTSDLSYAPKSKKRQSNVTATGPTLIETFRDNAYVPVKAQNSLLAKVQADVNVISKQSENLPPVEQMANRIVSWIDAIAARFPELSSQREEGKMFVTHGTERRVSLLFPSRKLDGTTLLDFVLWRAWKSIESPWFKNDGSYDEFIDKVQQAITENFASFSAYLTVEARMSWIFSDPSCAWIDRLLKSLESSIREYHVLRIAPISVENQDADRQKTDSRSVVAA